MIQNTIINEKWLKEFSPIPLNYNMKELHNYIKLAEAIWIVPVIGQTFYDELIDQVAENDLTEDNSTALVEAIYPYLGFAVAYEALPVMWAHISEVGITKGKSENLRTQVEARKDFCKKWLCERNTLFPNIDCCACGCSCCNENNGKLNNPNPYRQLYTTRRRMTDLR